MAKENFVLLVGSLKDVVRVNREGTTAKFNLCTIRRNDKYDEPTVCVHDRDLISRLADFSQGDFIMVKGIVATRDVSRQAECPQCHRTVEIKGTVTEVIAISAVKIGRDYALEDLKEVSNVVRILGTVCRTPVTSQTGRNGATLLCKYQIAANRKLNVTSEPNIYADYPWVNSFGRQAEQDMMHLETGSQIYIDGGLQTRIARSRNAVCTECGTHFKVPGAGPNDIITEIVPFSVEYLNNCRFDAAKAE